VLTLRVADNGHGFDITRAGNGHGLRSMRERTEAVGGHVDVRSAPPGHDSDVHDSTGRSSVGAAARRSIVPT
jgi:signal transduction histidine kinase